MATNRQHADVGSVLVSSSVAVRKPVGFILFANVDAEICQRYSGLRIGRNRFAG